MIEKRGTLNHHSVQLKCVLLHLVMYYECFTDGFWRGEINVCAIVVIYCHCEKAAVPDSVSCKHHFPWICLVFLKQTFPIKYSSINACENLVFYCALSRVPWVGFASTLKILHLTSSGDPNRIKPIFKGIVHPKMKICWKCPRPQAIQDEFIYHLFTNGSSTVNGCRPNSWSTSNPHDSSPSINILWSEKLDISKKHPSLTAIHNIAFSIENVFSSELGEE